MHVLLFSYYGNVLKLSKGQICTKNYYFIKKREIPPPSSNKKKGPKAWKLDMKLVSYDFLKFPNIFEEHLLPSPYEYSTEWGHDAIASQFITQRTWNGVK